MNTVSAFLVAFRAVRFRVFVAVSISLAITNIKFNGTAELSSELSSNVLNSFLFLSIAV